MNYYFSFLNNIENDDKELQMEVIELQCSVEFNELKKIFNEVGTQNFYKYLSRKNPAHIFVSSYETKYVKAPLNDKRFFIKYNTYFILYKQLYFCQSMYFNYFSRI